MAVRASASIVIPSSSGSSGGSGVRAGPAPDAGRDGAAGGEGAGPAHSRAAPGLRKTSTLEVASQRVSSSAAPG